MTCLASSKSHPCIRWLQRNIEFPIFSCLNDYGGNSCTYTVCYHQFIDETMNSCVHFTHCFTAMSSKRKGNVCQLFSVSKLNFIKRKLWWVDLLQNSLAQLLCNMAICTRDGLQNTSSVSHAKWLFVLSKLVYCYLVGWTRFCDYGSTYHQAFHAKNDIRIPVCQKAVNYNTRTCDFCYLAFILL